jgi:hypothetical protein
LADRGLPLALGKERLLERTRRALIAQRQSCVMPKPAPAGCLRLELMYRPYATRRVARPLRFSSCLTVVVLEHPGKPFATLDLTDNLADAFFRIDQPVVEALMVALFVVMRYKLSDCPTK